ncbi:hypothetical protein BDZ90DRAFT_253921 [Jaminaea rosea]|uniref:Aminoacyl-transfer RNA synthetases class-II family profile domain-containing protein n=1 Tax=Jaminaea rosea TaxID=1569628 RepID=A0A316UTV0_9BASI|nr:hypothetical protein BDZ90DRAFT_253921 [Jaminaea rosea]PWN26515.1 hypothetical protein BDZ90DRAFT_253921 [Jaminaea rosea]
MRHQWALVQRLARQCAASRASTTLPRRLLASQCPILRRQPFSSTPKRREDDAFLGWLPPRTHSASSIYASDEGKEVTLSGWLLPCRKISNSLSFHPLRDSTGVVQLVARNELVQTLANLPPESVVHVTGQIGKKKQKQQNPPLRAGESSRLPSSTAQDEVEVEVFSYHLLGRATSSLPFQPSDAHNLPSEELRAKYRYLDLRRPQLTHNIRLRSRVTHAIRSYLHDEGFLEIETPLLLRSTPEGAREFLVPSRLAPASEQDEEVDAGAPTFYALPQSPQQPKQLLMASGVTDRYFQIAKCFRDEAGRKDRQPEFTQVDLEMAFVDGAAPPQARDGWAIGGSQVRRVIEGLVRAVWREAKGVDPLEHEETGFEVMTYQDAMRRYGSDKPDVRFGLEIVDLCPYIRDKLERFKSSSSSSSASPHALAKLLLHKSSHLRSHLEDLEINPADLDAELLAQGVAEALRVGRADPNTLTSDGQEEDVHLFVNTRHSPADGGSTELGELRLRLRDALASRSLLPAHLLDPTLSQPRFLWITQFPLLTRSDPDKADLSQGRWNATHHPFTAPSVESLPALKEVLQLLNSIQGQHYDLVLNGVELGGGSVRLHSASLQRAVMEKVLALQPHEVKRFDHLLSALASGCPPHAGIALGLDRLVAMLVEQVGGTAASIRDVIAFPKSAGGRDKLFGAPSVVGGDEGGARGDEEERVLNEFRLRRKRDD